MEGQRLGNYRIVKKIGHGAMGEVYLADQLSMARKVALKILPQRLTDDERFVKRFIREARAAGTLNHANLVHVYDVGKINNVFYFSMEYVDGESVKAVIKRDGHIDPLHSVDIAIEICQALDHAHKHNIIHRDVKPDNIMLTKAGHAKLADLGLARQIQPNTRSDVTQDGVAVGTPHYMAPEQAKGQDVDIRADIYSLGATLYHMLSGQTPFESDTPMGILMKHATEDPPPLMDWVPGLPKSLYQTIDKMMQKDPEDRLQTPEEALDALRAIRRELSPDAAPAGKKAGVIQRIAVWSAVLLFIVLLLKAASEQKQKAQHLQREQEQTRRKQMARAEELWDKIQYALNDPEGEGYGKLLADLELLQPEIPRELWPDDFHEVLEKLSFFAEAEEALAGADDYYWDHQDPKFLKERRRRWERIVHAYPDTPAEQAARARLQNDQPPLFRTIRKNHGRLLERLEQDIAALSDQGKFEEAQKRIRDAEHLTFNERMRLTEMLRRYHDGAAGGRTHRGGPDGKRFHETMRRIEDYVHEGKYLPARAALNRIANARVLTADQQSIVKQKLEEVNHKIYASRTGERIKEQLRQKVMWRDVKKLKPVFQTSIHTVNDDGELAQTLRVQYKDFLHYIAMFENMFSVLGADTASRQIALRSRDHQAISGTYNSATLDRITLLTSDGMKHFYWKDLNVASIAKLAIDTLPPTPDNTKTILAFTTCHEITEQSRQAHQKLESGPHAGHAKNDVDIKRYVDMYLSWIAEDDAYSLIEDIRTALFKRSPTTKDYAMGLEKFNQLESDYKQTNTYKKNVRSINKARITLQEKGLLD